MERREFIRNGATAGLGVFVLNKSRFNQINNNKPRIGFIGVGTRGTKLLGIVAERGDVEIPAVCDVIKDRVVNSQNIAEEALGKRPEGYSKDGEDYRRMLSRDDLDGVIIATPRKLHAKMCVDSMNAGIYAATEVPAAMSIDECWDLINTHEKTGVHCMLLENYVYFRNCMAILNMVRQGLFGTLTHCECGYQHDTRHVIFGQQGELTWRYEIYSESNGIMYPTHGIGPVAGYLNINRGNNFSYISAMSTKSFGLNNYIDEHFGKDHPKHDASHALGDVVSALIKCNNGETITINYDTITPRPAYFGYLVQGTNGIWMDAKDSIYLQNKSPERHKWESFKKYQKEYDHPAWKKYGEQAEELGHSGSDFFVVNDFIESVKHNIAPPIDVYDGAAWSSIIELSEESINNGGMPVKFPDFTRGRWKTNKPIFGI